jgi:FlaA1/EpsC-like NDP-sugar epimerase
MTYRILKNFAPRWIIFCLDIILISAAFGISYFLIDQDTIEIKDFYLLIPALLTNFVISLGCIMVFAIYKGIIRYSEIMDIIRVMKFALLQFAVWSVVYLSGAFPVITNELSLASLFVNFVVVTFMLVAFRLLVKEVYFRAQARPRAVHRALIFGAGKMGQITRKVLEIDDKAHTTIVGFIDDSPYKIGKKLEGVPIHSAEGDQLVSLLKTNGITHLYIAVDNITVERKIALTDICGPYKVKINVVPHMSEWSGGVFRKNQLKEMNIEDLLERDEINLPNDILIDTYQHATVLVTGASGSIGSEICRQLAKIKFRKLILVDQSESGLFDLEYEIRQQYGKDINIQIEIASVRDVPRMKKIFSANKPEFVFHAAAYKHVPLMEIFPCEAILTNIMGTKLVAELSLFYQVKKFVLISTDKAVNPTNIMGATKRISELYVQNLSDHKSSKTDFIITRFGNVLGSNGSVVETFKKQIREGGPITITHPDITRYFMTIPEASKLVLEAGKIGRSGDILLFDMGKPVKIIDLARRMIQLAGLKPNEDIAILQTQLRPGEKMYEELFKDTEEFIQTDHPRILQAVKKHSLDIDLNALLSELEAEAILHNNKNMPVILNKILPEFSPYLYLQKTNGEVKDKEKLTGDSLKGYVNI